MKIENAIKEVRGLQYSVSKLAQVLERQLPKPKPEHCAAREMRDIVLPVVCRHVKVNPQSVLGRGRPYDIAKARFIAMFLVHEKTDCNLGAISKAFNRKDHSLISYAIKSVRDRYKTEKQFAVLMDNIRAELAA